MNQEINIVISAQMEEFTRAMREVSDSTNGLTGPLSKATSGVGKMVKGFGKVAGAIGVFKLLDTAINGITSSVGDAISRVDTLNQFPKVLEQMGYSAEEAEKSTDKLSKGIQGLPTTLNGIVGSTQRLVNVFGDVDKATDSALALNSAFLASGASQEDASRGLDQYIQMLSAGKVDMQSWRTLQETMPYALNETAKAFGFTGASAQNDFYAALQSGDITMDQFNEKVIELSEGQGGFAEVALEASKGISTSMSNIKTAVVNGVAGAIQAFDEWLDSKGIGGIAGALDVVKAAVSNAFSKVNEIIPQVLDWFSKLYEKVKESTAWNTLKELVNGAVDTIQGLWDKFTETGALEDAGTFLKDIGEAILEIDFVKLTEDIGAFLDKWSPLIAGISGSVATFYAISAAIAVWTAITGIATGVGTAFAAVMGFILSPVGLVVIAIGLLIGIFVLLWKYWDEISAWLASSWQWLKDTAVSIFDAIGIDIIAVWNWIKGTTLAVWDYLTGKLIEGWNVLVSAATAVFNFLKPYFSALWNGIKAVAMAVWNGIKSFLSASWNGIKSTASTIFNVMKTIITTVFNAVKSTITNVWNGIKSFLSASWNGIKSTATTIFNGIKTAITKPIETAKNTIKKAVDAIKGFFSNMKLKFPKISMPKLPKFSLTGKFSLMPPSVPKVGVNWYATGGIATGPSVVGIGEAGDEAILPLSNKSKMRPFANAVSSMLDKDGDNGGPTIINNYTINATIREDADIDKISKAIVDKQERLNRAGGRR